MPSVIADIFAVAAIAGPLVEAMTGPKMSPTIARTESMLRSHNRAFMMTLYC
jgi:hypothetical protein